MNFKYCNNIIQYIKIVYLFKKMDLGKLSPPCSPNRSTLVRSVGYTHLDEYSNRLFVKAKRINRSADSSRSPTLSWFLSTMPPTPRKPINNTSFLGKRSERSPNISPVHKSLIGTISRMSLHERLNEQLDGDRIESPIDEQRDPTIAEIHANLDRLIDGELDNVKKRKIKRRLFDCDDQNLIEKDEHMSKPVSLPPYHNFFIKKCDNLTELINIEVNNIEVNTNVGIGVFGR